LKALVKTTAGVGFTLQEMPEPRIRDNEVLVRVRRAGVCGTDVHIYEWDDWARGPLPPAVRRGPRVRRRRGARSARS
jgi:threonine 3-dehydrogenase